MSPGFPNPLTAYAVVVALTIGARSQAEAGISLAWSNCVGESGSTSSVILDCSGPGGIGPNFYGTFLLNQPYVRCVTMEVQLDVMIEGAASIPPFWQIFGCGDGNLEAYRNIPNPFCPGYTRTWGRPAIDLPLRLTIENSVGGSPNRMRITFTAYREAGDPIDLSASPVQYFGFVCAVYVDHADRCEGCSSPVVIVWNRALLHSETAEPLELTSTDPGSLPCITANGASACAAVPARAQTWGALKALYR